MTALTLFCLKDQEVVDALSLLTQEKQVSSWK